jgi:hypothetical protein
MKRASTNIHSMNKKFKISQQKDKKTEKTTVSKRDDYLSSVESLIQRSLVFPKTLNTESLLSLLPDDIYYVIIDVLSISDTANLNISCKKLYLKTHNPYIKRLLDEKIIPFLVQFDRSVCICFMFLYFMSFVFIQVFIDLDFEIKLQKIITTPTK